MNTFPRHHLRLLHLELLHPHEVLRNLGETLLALVQEELGPVDEVLVDLYQGRGIRTSSASVVCRDQSRDPRIWTHLVERFCVVARQLDSLPHLARKMCPLDRLHVEVHLACSSSKRQAPPRTGSAWLGRRRAPSGTERDGETDLGALARWRTAHSRAGNFVESIIRSGCTHCGKSSASRSCFAVRSVSTAANL